MKSVKSLIHLEPTSSMNVFFGTQKHFMMYVGVEEMSSKHYEINGN